MPKINIELDEAQAQELVERNKTAIEQFTSEINTLEQKKNSLVQQNESILNALNGTHTPTAPPAKRGRPKQYKKFAWRNEINGYFNAGNQKCDADGVAQSIAKREGITDEGHIKFIRNHISIGLAGMYQDEKVGRNAKTDKPSEYWYHLKS